MDLVLLLGEMVYNEQLKHEIPIGWNVRPFDEIYDVRKGSLITEKEASAGTIKVVAAGLSYSYLHSESNRPANTITISASGANAGYVNFWREKIFASDCITVRGDSDIDTLLAYHFLESMQKALLKKATGSAQPHVYPDDVKHFMICEIPEDLKNKIKHILITWNKKATCVQLESNELAALRDFLLPRVRHRVRLCVTQYCNMLPTPCAIPPPGHGRSSQRSGFFLPLTVRDFCPHLPSFSIGRMVSANAQLKVSHSCAIFISEIAQIIEPPSINTNWRIRWQIYGF